MFLSVMTGGGDPTVGAISGSKPLGLSKRRGHVSKPTMRLLREQGNSPEAIKVLNTLYGAILRKPVTLFLTKDYEGKLYGYGVRGQILDWIRDSYEIGVNRFL